MCRALLCALTLILLSSPVDAQEVQRFEAFGGYQFTRFSRIDNLAAYHDVLNASGFSGAVAYYFTSWAALDGDFGAAFGNDTLSQANGPVDLVTYSAGPRFSAPLGRSATVFSEFLIGGYHEAPRAGNRVTGVAVLAGGGVDVKVSPRADVRIFDLDWLRYATGNGSCLNVGCQSASKNNFRFSAGVVIHF